MKTVLGVDLGGSATKIVGLCGDELIGTLQVKADDKITALYGAIGNFLQMKAMKPADISAVYLTGVGASFFDGDILDIPTHKADEFLAIGRGGQRLSGLNEAIVVSMGTGTAFVRASGNDIRRFGGSGVGGGTLVGLSSILINEDDMARVSALAREGQLENVDLLIRAITRDAMSALPPDATAANFGNLKRSASKGDLAVGIISLVIQTVGMLSVFACANDSIKDVVLTGMTAGLPQCREIMDDIEKMCGVRFHIPENAVYATAIGATL